MPSIEELKAALQVAELEEELQEAKRTPEGPSQGLKADLREARRTYRELREARPVEPGDARPDVIRAGTAVNGEGE